MKALKKTYEGTESVVWDVQITNEELVNTAKEALEDSGVKLVSLTIRVFDRKAELMIIPRQSKGKNHKFPTTYNLEEKEEGDFSALLTAFYLADLEGNPKFVVEDFLETPSLTETEGRTLEEVLECSRI